MTNFIIRRLIQNFITLIALSFICFSILALMPGDPVDLMMSANPKITTDDVARLKALYGLDQPIYMRYYNWMAQVVQGDLGYSRTYKVPVTEIIGPRLLNTFFLLTGALLLAIIVAIPLGVVAAVKSGSKLDYYINLMAFAGISIPSFWLALILIIVFSLNLGWFPAGGTETIGVNLTGFEYFLDRLKYMMLPILSLTIIQMGIFARYARSAMLETLKADYVRTARSKGISRIPVIMKHAFRNALIPIVTVIAINFSFIFSGAIITETIFSYQGVGKLVYDAILANDFNVAMVSFMISVGMVLFMSLVADLLYGFLDPRISYN
ncbi:MAG: ABC transporter permease [Bdellovibrionaceae bacterium]|nr:ABC transporter permease [Pseudobdellovibrionaceae bacterium]